MPKPENIEPHKFKKGQTGNPKGRPKKLPNLDVLLANVLGEENKDGISAAEAILIKLRAEAAKGNIRAAQLILDRAYGKAKQPIEHSGPDGGPIETVIKFIDDSKDADNINQEEL